MDRSTAPWRVLEADPPTDPGPGPGHERPASRGSGGRPGPGIAAWWIVAGCALALIIGAGALAIVASGPQPVAVVERGTVGVAAATADSAGPAAADTRIVVDVAGAVRRPGIVELPVGARVADAIEAAGGFGPRVDAERASVELNLAAVLADGDHLIVPTRDETPTASDAGVAPTSNAGGGPVDLNHADSAALDALPGVGPVTVSKILAARAERPFRTLDELVERKVLGAATLAKIRELVTLR